MEMNSLHIVKRMKTSVRSFLLYVFGKNLLNSSKILSVAINIFIHGHYATRGFTCYCFVIVIMMHYLSEVVRNKGHAEIEDRSEDNND